MADAADPASLSEALKTANADALRSQEALNRAMQSFVKLQNDARTNASPKQWLEATKLVKATQSLVSLEKERLSLGQQLKDLNTEDVAQVAKLTAAIRQNESAWQANKSVVVAAQKQITETILEARKRVQENNTALVEQWKQYSIGGRVFSSLTGAISKYTAAITASAIAGKALARVRDSAILQQDLQIRSFRTVTDVQNQAAAGATNVETANKGLVGGFSDLVGAVTGFATSNIASRDSVQEMSSSIASARANAVSLGKDAGEVTGVMAEFARITGSTNPRALSALTSAAMTVSKELQITTSEAMEYVTVRMNKFGGSAADAISQMELMRRSTLSLNDSFGRTVIRADDLARTMLDVGKDSSVYALDQKYLSDVMLTSISRLQAMGDSYDQARAKAKAFTEILASKGAPDFMKYFAGVDLTGGITKSLAGVRRLADG